MDPDLFQDLPDSFEEAGALSAEDHERMIRFVEEELKANRELYEGLASTESTGRDPLVIFIDIDGPLVPIRNTGNPDEQHLYKCATIAREVGGKDPWAWPPAFEPEALRNFLTIFWALEEEYKVYVVCSSTWRTMHYLEVKARFLKGEISTDRRWQGHFPAGFNINLPGVPEERWAGRTPHLNGRYDSFIKWDRGAEISAWLRGKDWVEELSDFELDNTTERDILRFEEGGSIRDFEPFNHAEVLAIDDDFDVAPHLHLHTQGLTQSDVAWTLRQLWPRTKENLRS